MSDQLRKRNEYTQSIGDEFGTAAYEQVMKDMHAATKDAPGVARHGYEAEFARRRLLELRGPRDLTAEDLAALRSFAAEYGRKWKSVLAETYWYNARVFYARGNHTDSIPGSLLHGLRNSHGPSWLHSFKLPAE